jgi:hypothetical protein
MNDDLYAELVEPWRLSYLDPDDGKMLSDALAKRHDERINFFKHLHKKGVGIYVDLEGGVETDIKPEFLALSRSSIICAVPPSSKIKIPDWGAANNAFHVLQLLASKYGKKQTIGTRSNIPPVWITADGRKVGERPEPYAAEIRIGLRNAYRGKVINLVEARDYLQEKIEKDEAITLKYIAKRMYLPAQNKREEIHNKRNDLELLNFAISKGFSAGVKIKSGTCTFFNVIGHYSNVTAPKIALIPALENCIVRPANRRNSKNEPFVIQQGYFEIHFSNAEQAEKMRAQAELLCQMDPLPRLQKSPAA